MLKALNDALNQGQEKQRHKELHQKIRMSKTYKARGGCLGKLDWNGLEFSIPPFYLKSEKQVPGAVVDFRDVVVAKTNLVLFFKEFTNLSTYGSK